MAKPINLRLLRELDREATRRGYRVVGITPASGHFRVDVLSPEAGRTVRITMSSTPKVEAHAVDNALKDVRRKLAVVYT